MDKNSTDNEYQPFKIPDRQQTNEIGADCVLPDKKNVTNSIGDGLFYEIEYDSYPVKGVGKFVLKSQKIEPLKKDETREVFYSMRDISRNLRSDFIYNRPFDRGIQQNIAAIFYKQAIFMKDFTDSHTKNEPFSAYFPNYQMMNYEQLRTYFTWRTLVRQGNVTDTSLSYAFLYIYELLNNIGVESPKDGLEKLMAFWKTFSVYNTAIDKYVIRWLKDYHVYYDLPKTFKEFAKENNLLQHYPKIADTLNEFDLFCAVSKYDIKKSAFFTDNKKLITDCWNFVTDKLRGVLLENGHHFDNSIFAPTKKMSSWQPFKDAIFHPWLKQADRRVVLSQYEIYICKHNKWEWNNVIISESGKSLIGYIMKQMESVLRKIMKYKFKLNANINLCSHPIVDKLKKCGLPLENIITSAVIEFYKELTKVVVTVDSNRLTKIRLEALQTQEKLIVEIPDEVINPGLQIPNAPLDILKADLTEDIWENFKNSLNDTQINALTIILSAPANIKQFADENGMMLEVLIDDINEKATDFIGDNIFDDELIIYDDYIDNIKEMVKRL